VADYTKGVLSGRITAGKWVRLAVARNVRDLRSGPSRGLRFDEERAAIACDFFGLLCHSKGEWAKQPFVLEPWQAFIVWCLFGWVRQEDNLRRFRTAMVEIARKNGKSTFGAGIGLELLIADDEPGAEIYTAATKREQAIIIHSEATRMVQASAALTKRVQVFRNNLSVADTNSKYEPLGADSNTSDGLNVHGAIIDELHAHKTREMWDVLETATSARRQPLQLTVTTAGAGNERTGICWEQHDYCCKILDPANPLTDDTYFAFIAAIDDEDDWMDETCWAKANPNLGVSVKLDDLRRKASKAKQIPAAENNFRRKHLNQWTESVTAWLPDGLWASCSTPVDLAALRGRTCYAGLDLATVRDCCALALVFPQDDGTYDLLLWCWCPRERATERQKSRRGSYLTWAKQGHIELTDGTSTDYRLIRKRLNELAKVYRIKEVAFDPYNASHLVTELQDEDGLEMVEFRQGFLSMSPPTKELERLLLDKKIRHGGNPLLAWMASNAATRTDPAENVKLDKDKSGDKIDGVIASIMALGRAMGAGSDRSIYEDRDPLEVAY